MAQQKPKSAPRQRQNVDKVFQKPEVRIDPRTPTQKELVSNIRVNDITISNGPAGVGKTYLCVAVATQMLLNNKIERIVLTRPAVSLDEEHGFMPGTLDEKFLVWTMPFIDSFEKILGKTFYEYLVKIGKITVSPLAFIRGRSLDNSFIILDECQNATVSQVIAVATRLGENTKLVVNGDLSQTDRIGENGLTFANKVLSSVQGVGCVTFTSDDIVRSGICQRVVKAVEEHYREKPNHHKLLRK